MLQDQDMPVDEAPEDDGEGAPRQSYNFAPGYHGIVYRADVPHYGAGPRHQSRHSASTDAAEATNADNAESSPAADEGISKETHYKLQSMKWGLIPFWTKRNPDYGSMMKTINCRDDSLAQSGGMWNTMKARKRCIVIAQGFYEWLKKDGSKDRIPHYVKRKDGNLMCFAGLWDCVQYEGDDTLHYTYTIVTTDSNKQLKFLHDRMPVILNNGSEELRTWLDPKRHEWSKELQSLLKPFDEDLDVYPVSKDVGKVGNNSPTFVVPLDSKENKSNIANFFAKGASKPTVGQPMPKKQPEIAVKKESGFVEEDPDIAKDKIASDVGESLAKMAGAKRGLHDSQDGDEPVKKALRSSDTLKLPALQKEGRSKISATRNGTKIPQKPRQGGTQKITKFFGNSS
jgi:putative SOS response-associated peptidase YedK